MFVGHSVHHKKDVYRMLNIDTKSIIQSRDIIWLNEIHNYWIERKVPQKKEIDDDDDENIILRIRKSKKLMIVKIK
jgi:hypothetical protein